MKIKLNFLHMYCRNKRNIKIINCCNTSYSLCPIYIKKKIQNKQDPHKTRGRGWGRGAMQPPPLSQFNAKQKSFSRNYPISFLFSHKEHLKHVFKASREAQMQNFKTMMNCKNYLYHCNNTFLAPPLLQIHHGPWSKKLTSS